MSDYTAGSASIGKSRAIRWLMMVMTAVQVIGLLAGPSLAETLWTPAVEITATQNDNIEYARTDPVDDYVYTAQPQLRLDYEQELTSITADGSATIRRYQDNDQFDDELYKFELEGKSSFSERFRLEGNYEFIKDTTLDSELQETGRIYLRENRSSHDMRLTPRFNLTERVSIGLSGRYRDVAYDSDVFVDYSVWSVSVPVSWRLETQVDSIFISPGYTNRDSDTTLSKTYHLWLGWNHKTTERLNLTLSAGVRHTELEQKATGETDKNWNGVGNLRLNYKFETGYLRIDFQHNLRNTADGNQVNVSRVMAHLRRHFTERSGMELIGSYYNSKTEAENSDDTREYFTAGSTLFYNLTENHYIFIAYQYSQDYQENIQDDPRAEQNLIWAGIRLSFPMK